MIPFDPELGPCLDAIIQETASAPVWFHGGWHLCDTKFIESKTCFLEVARALMIPRHLLEGDPEPDVVVDQ